MKQHARDEVLVAVDAYEGAVPRAAGRLRRSGWGERADITFEYDHAWREASDTFDLEPTLPRTAGEHRRRTGGQLPGIFSDAAPDRWGRKLLERREVMLADREGRKARPFDEWDFLLAVDDATRMGALRLRRPSEGTFIDDQPLAVPPKTDLRHLEAAADRVERGAPASNEFDRWLEALIAPGASLGGSRPKATFVNSDGALWIAKFPAPSDRRDWGAWEYILAELATRAGIIVPPHDLLRLGSQYHTFMARRFDREGTHRRMFASAMTLLEQHDHPEDQSYLDIATAIEVHGTPTASAIAADLEQLFRRAVFNALSGHRDDHLRNHGFLHDGIGWRLSPAFDQNPIPDKVGHELAFDATSTSPDLGHIVATARHYRLNEKQTSAIVSDTRAAVSNWRGLAKDIRIDRDEQALMENAFMV